MAKNGRPIRRQAKPVTTMAARRLSQRQVIPGLFKTGTLAGHRIKYYRSPELAKAEEKRLKRLLESQPEAFAREYSAKRIKYHEIFARCAIRLKKCNIEVNLDEARIKEDQTDSGHANIYIGGIKISGMPKWEEADIILAETIRQREELEIYMLRCQEINWQSGQKIKLQKYPLDISNSLAAIESFIRSRGQTEILSYHHPKKP